MRARREERNEMSTNGELRLQRLVIDQVPEHMQITAVDVGARIGDWSKEFVQAAAPRRGGYQLHAFEPAPHSVFQIQQTLENEVAAGHVVIKAIALSNESATVPFYVPELMGGTSTLHPDASINYLHVVDVETSTLDRYCMENAIDHIDIVKIDTEGNDLRVIQGMLGMLESGKIGVVQFEYNHRWIYSRSYLKDVFDIVKNSPYSLAKVCSSALEVYIDWHPELERFFEANYALVHDRHLAALGCRFLRIGASNTCELVEKSRADLTVG